MRTELTPLCRPAVSPPLGHTVAAEQRSPRRPHGDSHEGWGPAGGPSPPRPPTSCSLPRPPPPPFPRGGSDVGRSGARRQRCRSAPPGGLCPAVGGGWALWAKRGAYAGLHIPARPAPAARPYDVSRHAPRPHYISQRAPRPSTADAIYPGTPRGNATYPGTPRGRTTLPSTPRGPRPANRAHPSVPRGRTTLPGVPRGRGGVGTPPLPFCWCRRGLEAAGAARYGRPGGAGPGMGQGGGRDGEGVGEGWRELGWRENGGMGMEGRDGGMEGWGWRWKDGGGDGGLGVEEGG